MTSSAAGDERTIGRSGARSSMRTVPGASCGPVSTTASRNPSLRRAAAAARSTSSRVRARTTNTRSRSTPARTAASGSNVALGSIHSTVPPSRWAPAAARCASATLPPVPVPTNASGAPDASPGVSASSELSVPIRRSPARRSATAPCASTCVPNRPSTLAIASARAVFVRAWPTRNAPRTPFSWPGLHRTDVLTIGAYRRGVKRRKVI